MPKDFRGESARGERDFSFGQQIVSPTISPINMRITPQCLFDIRYRMFNDAGLEISKNVEKQYIANNMKVSMLEYKFKMMNTLTHCPELVILTNHTALPRRPCTPITGAAQSKRTSISGKTSSTRVPFARIRRRRCLRGGFFIAFYLTITKKDRMIEK